MVTVTVAIDEAVLARWQRVADEHHRELEAEIAAVLERAAPMPMTWAEAKHAAETIRAGVPVAEVPSEIAIRQMRDER